MQEWIDYERNTWTKGLRLDHQSSSNKSSTTGMSWAKKWVENI